MSEVASGGRCQQVAEWVLTGFGRQGEQVCSEGRPRRFAGESGDVPGRLGRALDDLGSDELLGCDVEAVGVALDRLEEPGRWVVEFAQQRCWRRPGASSRARICCSVSVGVRG